MKDQLTQYDLQRIVEAGVPCDSREAALIIAAIAYRVGIAGPIGPDNNSPQRAWSMTELKKAIEEQGEIIDELYETLDELREITGCTIECDLRELSMHAEEQIRGLRTELAQATCFEVKGQYRGERFVALIRYSESHIPHSWSIAIRMKDSYSRVCNNLDNPLVPFCCADEPSKEFKTASDARAWLTDWEKTEDLQPATDTTVAAGEKAGA